MSGLFSRPPNRAVPSQPTANDPGISAARAATGKAAAEAYGRGATVATSGRGVEAPAAVAKKTLLGGAGG